MIALFIHQSFPAQYRHLVRHLADSPGNTVYFITKKTENVMLGVEMIIYALPPVPSLDCHPHTVDFDMAVRHGAAVAEACRGLAARGVRPDIICGHGGWGEMMFVKDIFPDVPTVSYFEFYYHAQHVDVGFDPEFPPGPADAFRLRTRNATGLVTFDAVDWGHAPTRWQRDLHPPEMRSRISIIHEGVDTDQITPDAGAWIRLPGLDAAIGPRDEVVTYVARNLEPYRGFHIFMRAAREILRRRPRTHIVIIGGDGVSYGAAPADGRTWRQVMMDELGLGGESRLHFLGQIAHDDYMNILRVSGAHVYLTYPFVLSWSFIEAMACGCAIVASDTPPVMEVLKDGENGLAVDFFSPMAIADRVDHILDDPDRRADLRRAARATAVRDFDLKTKTLPRWLALIEDMINGRRPDILGRAASLGDDG
jgi:glycosyltransferase involved in cell wall biosynthesis